LIDKDVKDEPKASSKESEYRKRCFDATDENDDLIEAEQGCIDARSPLKGEKRPQSLLDKEQELPVLTV